MEKVDIKKEVRRPITPEDPSTQKEVKEKAKKTAENDI